MRLRSEFVINVRNIIRFLIVFSALLFVELARARTITINHGTKGLPMHITLMQGNETFRNATVPKGSGGSSTFEVPGTAALDILAVYHSVSGHAAGVMIREKIDVSAESTQVSFSVDDVRHSVSLKPIAPDGSVAKSGNLSWMIYNRSSLSSYYTGVSNLALSKDGSAKLKVSSFSTNYGVLGIASYIRNNEMVAHLYRLHNLTNSLSLSNAASDFLSKDIVATNNYSPNSGLDLKLIHNFTIPYPGSASYVFGVPGADDAIRANYNQRLKLRINSYSTAGFDLHSTDRIKPSIAIRTKDPLASRYSQSQVIGVASGKIAAFDSILSGPCSGSQFKVNITDLSNEDVIGIGRGVAIDKTKWCNYADQDVKLIGQNGNPKVRPLLNSDGSLEWASTSENYLQYILASDNGLKSSGNVVWTHEIIAWEKAGNYSFQLSKNIPRAGVMTKVSTRSSFALSAADSNPPALTDVKLIADDILQQVIDVNLVNTLKFSVDPVAGRSSLLNLMSDVISSVSVEISYDSVSYQQLVIKSLDESTFSAAIPVKAASLYSFRITMMDASGNSTQSFFQIPAGSALRK